MREDTRSSFEISTELPNNLHGKVNYSNKGKKIVLKSLQIGLIFSKFLFRIQYLIFLFLFSKIE